MKSKIILIISTALISLGTTLFVFFAMNKGEAEVQSTNDPLPGGVEIYTKATAPEGYLLCDGRAVSRTTYANLFNAIGTTYGAGDGSTTFNVPNLNGRTIIGTDSSYALASTGGSETHVHATKDHTLTIAEMPKHNHKMAFYDKNWTDTQDNYTNAVSWGAYTKTGVRFAAPLPKGADGGYVGGDQPHNHGDTESASSMQPYLTINYIIKY